MLRHRPSTLSFAALCACVLLLGGCFSVTYQQKGNSGCWLRATNKFGQVHEEDLRVCEPRDAPAPNDPLANALHQCISYAKYKWYNEALAAKGRGKAVAPLPSWDVLRQNCLSETEHDALQEMLATRKRLEEVAIDKRLLTKALVECSNKTATATASAQADGRSSSTGTQSEIKAGTVAKKSFSFAADALFASDQATLLPEGKKTLEKLATELRDVPGKIRVEGHTDVDAPRKFADNWLLSAERVRSVIVGLVELKVRPERLSGHFFAEHQPVDAAGTREAKTRNRRVEVFLESP